MGGKSQWLKILAAGALGPLLQVAAHGGVGFFGLGDLSGGGFESYASSISLDGSTVVGQGLSPAGYEAFRWTATDGIQSLGDLSGGEHYSAAYAVSANGGVIVGEARSASGQEAFRWTTSGGMSGLGDFPGSIFASFATATNANGTVIAGAGWPAVGIQQSFRWTNATGLVGLTLASGSFQEATAFGMSSDGAVIVGERGNEDAGAAFRWTASAGIVTLNSPSIAINGTNVSATSSARSVSANGLVTVGQATWQRGTLPLPTVLQEAMLWNGTSTGTRLGDLSGGTISAMANDVDATGAVVVGFGNTDNGYEAFIWDATRGMRRLQDVLEVDLGLDLTGWTLNSAEGISGDGMTITGWGIDPSGNPQAWVAVLPEPAMAATTLALMAVFSLRNRRR